eukprot:6187551-Pleurochrysis_carterae.AAC.2
MLGLSANPNTDPNSLVDTDPPPSQPFTLPPSRLRARARPTSRPTYLFRSFSGMAAEAAGAGCGSGQGTRDWGEGGG